MNYSMNSKYISYFLSGLVFALATLIPDISYGTTYYVAKKGDDSNPGTEISPFFTIKHGVSNLSAGDTLYVKTGTYKEGLLSWETPIPSGKSWNEPITVANYPGHIITIQPPPGLAFFWVKDGKAKYLIIDGFIIDGQHVAYHAFKFSDNSRYVRVQNTEIKNTVSQGVLITPCGGCLDPANAPHDTYHEFINIDVHHSGSTKFEHGMYIATSHNLVEGSKIHHNANLGIQVFMSGLNSANHNVFRNNIFYDNNTIEGQGCGLLLSSGTGNIAHSNIAYGNLNGFCTTYRATDTQLYNNVAYENRRSGIHIGKGSNGAKVSHNTIYQNSIYGIDVSNGAQGSSVRNNITYQNGNNPIYLQPDGQVDTTVSHNWTSEPEFVNAAGKDFRLQESSPAIDSGIMINEIPVDIIGHKRPQGANPDIGAYESSYGGADSEAPKTPIGLVVY